MLCTVFTDSGKPVRAGNCWCHNRVLVSPSPPTQPSSLGTRNVAACDDYTAHGMQEEGRENTSHGTPVPLCPFPIQTGPSCHHSRFACAHHVWEPLLLCPGDVGVIGERAKPGKGAQQVLWLLHCAFTLLLPPALESKPSSLASRFSPFFTSVTSSGLKLLLFYHLILNMNWL